MTRRLVGSYALLTLLVLIVFGIPLGLVFEREQTDRLVSDIERDATVLATLYEDALEQMLELDAGPADEYVARTEARVVITDRNGISRYDSEARVDRDLSTRPEIALALQGVHATGQRHSTTLNTDLVYAAVPVASGGTVHGVVRVTLDTDDVSEVTRRFWLGLTATSAIALLVAVVVGWVMAVSISRPLHRLQGNANRFAAGDLTTDEPVERLPELRSLESSMNGMARQLDETIQRQRRFVADASHQLRSPLTALRLRLENVLPVARAARSDAAGVGFGADGDVAADIERAIEETNRLGQLVEDLLKLASASRDLTPEPCELVGAVGERVDTWSTVADEADVRLDLDAPSTPVWAMALPGAIEQAVDNLLDNAIRAAPAGSTVWVSISRDESMARVTVRDEGEGMTDTAKQRAVERFWRGDSSQQGTGLGLAIVTELVAAAGGTTTLSDGPDGGLVVEITAPLARRDPRRPRPTTR